MNYTPDYYNDLELTLKYIKNECAVATKHHKHPMHQIYLSTFGQNYPELRTLVFRKQNLTEGYLVFHTDFRSQKFLELTKNSAASVLGYNPAKKYQIRFKGNVELHHKDIIAKSDWDKLGESSRKSYLTDFPPGQVSSIPTSGFAEGEISCIDGFERFVVGIFKITEIEWLYLNSEGHRRALFHRQADLSWSSQWLQP